MPSTQNTRSRVGFTIGIVVMFSFFFGTLLFASPETTGGNLSKATGKLGYADTIRSDYSGKNSQIVTSDGFVYEHNAKGEMIYEAVDFNKDGLLDDHYFYANDVLIRREIDTNYDGVIDIWVYISEGVYVAGYDRDRDYDGEVDISKRFGEEE